MNDKDPVWMNENIKSKTQTRNLLYQQYIQNTKFQCEFVFLETFISELNELIYKKKCIGQFLKPFLTRKSSANSISFGKREACNWY